jgi:hypothetical protein
MGESPRTLAVFNAGGHSSSFRIAGSYEGNTLGFGGEGAVLKSFSEREGRFSCTRGKKRHAQKSGGILKVND